MLPYICARDLVTADPYGEAVIRTALPPLSVGGRLIWPTEAFRSYWRFAAERQRIFFRRLAGERPPWTDDPVLATHRFTNAYRASDRVSQFLINEVIYARPTDERSTVLRVLLFKVFNRIDTWRYLESAAGPIAADNFEPARLAELMAARAAAGERLYSAAYIMPSPQLGSDRKHVNHLRLLERMMADGTIDRVVGAASFRELYGVLAGVHSFGRFLAFQFAVDLNYSPLYSFSEMDFVMAGPGARDGIAKCFRGAEEVAPEDVIRAVTEEAASLSVEAGASFSTLWGRRLQLVDCQNLFCEVGKYARVAHPELAGTTGRTRIKQRYLPSADPLCLGYPPKWALPHAAPAAVS